MLGWGALRIEGMPGHRLAHGAPFPAHARGYDGFLQTYKVVVQFGHGTKRPMNMDACDLEMMPMVLAQLNLGCRGW